ncbi:MAG: malto-oligosyltrehalose synthase [Desulfobulbaceae bacterium]|nr:malto-oligosyltrehalose synthase [Desulfobulbaceae bacterium]
MNKTVVKEIIELYGVKISQPEHDGDSSQDLSGKMRAFLTALNLDPEDDQSLARHLQELQQGYWSGIVDPLLVSQEEVPLRITLRLPAKLQANQIYWTLVQENNAEHRGDLSAQNLPVLQQKEINQQSYIAAGLELPLQLPCGYHTFSVAAGNSDENKITASCLVIIAPTLCYLPAGLQPENRVWGICCNLDTIRSKRDWGIGDFSDLKTVLEWGAESGAAAVAINSLQPMLPTQPNPIEKRRPTSLHFLSPLYLDIEAMDDFHECNKARDFVQDPTFQTHISRLRDLGFADYQGIAAIKIPVLQILWQHFQDNHLNPETDRGRQFRNFQQSGGDELWAWSIFAALQVHFQDQEEKGLQHWLDWPESFRHPGSTEISDFAQKHMDQLAFQQYIQWQVDLQLQAIGRRSMELGLKVGLVARLPASPGYAGFEEWRKQKTRTGNISVPSNGTPPLIHPGRMKKIAYDTWIAILRVNMRYAGGLRLDPGRLMEHQHLLPVSQECGKEISLQLPVHEILSLIALESQRNRCMVICEEPEKLADNFQTTLIERHFFMSHIGQFITDKDGSWLSPDRYPQQTVVSAGSDTHTLHDFWSGNDITRQTREQTARREKMIIARATDRAQLLVALQRQGLLPEGCDVDPVSVPVMTPALATAVHLFLAQSTARIFLLQLENIPNMLDPDLLSRVDEESPLQQRTLPIDLETIVTDNELSQLLETFSKERGIGVVKPSALLTGRHKSRTARIPHSFYRLQLNKDFSFARATNVVAYLEELGISHCYTSPYLQARPGSSHGYDIIDHSSINMEIGSREDYEEFVSALGRHNMAQIFDMVPNHMGVGSDNHWWMDVLENGQASLYADFFDINWQPQQEELQDRVLLPVLGSYYGTVLEDGQLCLEFVPDKGAFYISYFEHRFPVAPGTYPFILTHDLQRLEDRLSPQHEGFLELHSLVSSLTNLPSRQETDIEQIKMRHRNKEVLKRHLARLCREFTEIAAFIEENVLFFNGKKDDPESYDLLHSLLDQQTYRLAFWRVASDEINYRRFFDINELAGIRIEEQRVFEETHRLVLDLIRTGKIDGLRIDHPDGLYNPDEYFRRLQEAAGGSSIMEEQNQRKPLPLYVVVEKILTDFEHLRDDWQVHGTTGYDFSVTLNGLFVDSSTEKAMTLIYDTFINEKIEPDHQIYLCKKLIIKTAMAGELNVLAGELHKLAKMNRYTQDFTLNGLRAALTEIIAFFPVYRTYISSAKIDGNERNYIEWATAKAKARHQAGDTLIYDFIRSTMLLADSSDKESVYGNKRVDFVMKLQQYTGPIMAKGLEDTFCYIYNRLLSLNEVGGDPRRYGVSVAAFHHANSERQKHWPHAMLNTSTHDSKRSEDVRARINVLSEMPDEWQQALDKWSEINDCNRTQIETGLAPSRNDEYAFYQNLLGIWPLYEPDHEQKKELADRMSAYMLKVIREAKIHTSWINQDQPYEAAMETFVRSVFSEENNSFLAEFIPFQTRISWFGILNSLSQLLVKLTSPGIPDIYQGNEIWHFRLVDPDNRQPVDFEHRRLLLSDLRSLISGQTAEGGSLGNLLENISDGRVKLFTTWRTLSCRQQYPDLFEAGNYLPLQTRGSKKEHLFAFSRSRAGKILICAVPRLVAGLLDKKTGRLPLGRDIWQDTELVLPDDFGQNYKNILTGEEISTAGGQQITLPAAELFSSFPVVLLENEQQGADHERQN